MDLETAINHPKINVFDIIREDGGFAVKTYLKPNEGLNEYWNRHYRNVIKAKRLVKNKTR